VILGLGNAGNVADGGSWGTAVGGKRPTGKVALPAKHRTVHGGSGLTILKLRAARKQLGLDENDLSVYRPCMAITTNQHDDLLGIVEQANASLNMLEQPSIVDGKVTRLMGFDFVEMNGLPLTGSVRSCPVWLKHKVVLGIWQDVKPDMWNDSHAKNTPYIHVDAYMDCVRKEDTGVHVIECTEA